MSTLTVPGARLHYERDGTGPLLVMVPGASGAGDSFRPVTRHLTERFTVLLYDRRGFSRSPLDQPVDDHRRLQADADDVQRLIEHQGGGPAAVFGTSSGAIVALEAIARHPETIEVAVAFEPPLMRLLPDGRQWIERFTATYDEYRRSGPQQALGGFRTSTFAETDQAVMSRAPFDQANAVHWFEHELRQYPAVDLDLQALAGLGGRVVPAVGRDGEGHPCHGATVELAARLSRPVAVLPGGHVGFISHPADFAAELSVVLAQAGPGAGPIDWESSYGGRPHWDLGHPQRAFQQLAAAGGISGRVLDAGCGTGEHALLAAQLGLDVTGVDIAPTAIHLADAKACERGLNARFLVHDARRLSDLGELFDTVLDAGLFHLLDDRNVEAYQAGVRAVLRPGGRWFILAFSDREPGDVGPRRLARHDIEHAFANGWRLDALEPVTLETTSDQNGRQGWLIALTRT